jgi:hypothetical protein
MREGEKDRDGWGPSSNITKPGNKAFSAIFCSRDWNQAVVCYEGEQLCRTHARALGVI